MCAGTKTAMRKFAPQTRGRRVTPTKLRCTRPPSGASGSGPGSGASVVRFRRARVTVGGRAPRMSATRGEKRGDRSPEDEQSAALKSQLACPVCFDMMLPPIRQCPHGHTLCDACSQAEACQRCPVCRATPTNIRSLALEHAAAGLRVRCPHGGCATELAYSVVRRSTAGASSPFTPRPSPITAPHAMSPHHGPRRAHRCPPM